MGSAAHGGVSRVPQRPLVLWVPVNLEQEAPGLEDQEWMGNEANQPKLVVCLAEDVVLTLFWTGLRPPLPKGECLPSGGSA